MGGGHQLSLPIQEQVCILFAVAFTFGDICLSLCVCGRCCRNPTVPLTFSLFPHRDDYKQYYSPGSDYGTKKMIQLSASLKPMVIKSKEYGPKVIYNFYLDEMTEFGDFHLAKFGSKNRQLTELLSQSLQNRIVPKRQQQLS